MDRNHSSIFSYLPAIRFALIALFVIAVGLYVYSLVARIPAITLFEPKNKMENTATQLASIENVNQWVFLTIEAEEVVVLERSFLKENVCKIFRGSYDLGVRFDGDEWFTVNETDGRKTAHVTLPPITLLDGGIRDTDVQNIYGNADSSEKREMKLLAERQLRSRTLTHNNVRQAARNAERHFRSLFIALGCDEVEIEWTH